MALSTRSRPHVAPEAAPAPASAARLIAGGAMPDEAKAGRYIQRGSPGTVELSEVAGADHTDALATDPAGWEQRVLSFLGGALRW